MAAVGASVSARPLSVQKGGVDLLRRGAGSGREQTGRRRLNPSCRCIDRQAASALAYRPEFAFLTSREALLPVVKFENFPRGQKETLSIGDPAARRLGGQRCASAGGVRPSEKAPGVVSFLSEIAFNIYIFRNTWPNEHLLQLLAVACREGRRKRSPAF